MPFCVCQKPLSVILFVTPVGRRSDHDGLPIFADKIAHFLPTRIKLRRIDVRSLILAEFYLRAEALHQPILLYHFLVDNQNELFVFSLVIGLFIGVSRVFFGGDKRAESGGVGGGAFLFDVIHIT